MPYTKKFEKDLQNLKKDYKQNTGRLFFWVSQNMTSINENLEQLRKRIDDEFTYILYIFFLLINNDIFKAAIHMERFEKKYANSAYSKLQQAYFYQSTKRFELAYGLYIFLLKNDIKSYYLWQMLMQLCKDANWYDRGIALYQEFVKQGFSNDLAKFYMTDIVIYFYYLNMDFDISAELSKLNISLVLKLNLTRDQNEKGKFDTSLAWQSLKDIINLFEENNIEAFPTAGTLLGWHREDDLLPFDKDLDIALAPGEDMNFIKFLIEKNPRYLIEQNLPNFASYIAIRDLTTNCTIDILSFCKNVNFYESGWLLPGKFKKHSRVTRFTPFELVKKQWKDKKFFTPKNFDLYLSELYGDWRVEDMNYFSILCANVVKRTPMIDAISYRHIMQNLLYKNYKKVIVIIDTLFRYGNQDIYLRDLKKQLTQR